MENFNKACPAETGTPIWKMGNSEFGNLKFPPLETTGTQIYPIVDSFDWIKRLAPLEVGIMQLRIKNLNGKSLENEIVRSIECAAQNECRLFINDYWELAIKHSAYGVHLGQGDLISADLGAIASAGLRLGISSHCHFELSKAISLKPSYVAFGPVYETKLKKMEFPPQGAERLKAFRAIIDIPLVAIGGITLENSTALLEGEPDFIAVVRDITQSKNPIEKINAWREFLSACAVN